MIGVLKTVKFVMPNRRVFKQLEKPEERLLLECTGRTCLRCTIHKVESGSRKALNKGLGDTTIQNRSTEKSKKLDDPLTNCRSPLKYTGPKGRKSTKRVLAHIQCTHKQ